MCFSVDPVLSRCLVYSKQSAKLCLIFHVKVCETVCVYERERE